MFGPISVDNVSDSLRRITVCFGEVGDSIIGMDRGGIYKGISIFVRYCNRMISENWFIGWFNK